MTNKRSLMTREQAKCALAQLASRVERMLESSSGVDGPGSFAPDGTITVKLQCKGRFGDNDDAFEAIRIFGGHKLAKDDK